MENLDNQINTYVEILNKLNKTDEFQNKLDTLQSVYPFNKYEYIIANLLSKNIICYSDYQKMRDEYLSRNIFLYVFELSPRTFGDTWGLSYIKSIEPELKIPKSSIDGISSEFKGEYDLYIKHYNKVIRIELKASRVNNREEKELPIVEKALSSSSNKSFLMNFQQLKPYCCDVFIWVAVYRDEIKCWVISSKDIQNSSLLSSQHRRKITDIDNQIEEGQIMITEKNIHLFDKYLIKPKNLLSSILEQFENNNSL